MSLSVLYTNLQDSFSFVNSVIAKANIHFHNAADSKVRELMIESAFLKMFIYWEEFLEKTFHCYLNGNTHLQGSLPIIYVSPLDDEHAAKILIGTQKYVDWANHEIVKKLATLYLENGSPYVTVLDSIRSDLSDLKNIRNSTAHISTTTTAAFNAVKSRTLGNISNSVNLSTCDFLMHLSPTDNTKTILQSYQDKLLAAAFNISSYSNI